MGNILIGILIGYVCHPVINILLKKLLNLVKGM